MTADYERARHPMVPRPVVVCRRPVRAYLEHPVSELFDQEDRRLCYRLRYFCHIILKYRQGEVPDQPFSDLCRTRMKR